MARRKRDDQQLPRGFELESTFAVSPDTDDGEPYAARLAWHPDGDTLVALTAHGLWYRGAGDGGFSLGYSYDPELHSLAFSPDGDTIVAATREGVLLVDFHSGDELRRLVTDRREAMIWDAAWSPDGSKIASLSHAVRIWDAASGDLLRSFKLRSNDTAFHLAWSPDSTRIAWAAGAVHVHFADTGEEWQQLAVDGNASSVTWSSDGSCIGINCADSPHQVLLWNLESEELITLYSGDQEFNMPIGFSADGRLLAAPCGNALRIWSVADRSLFAALEISEHSSEAFAFHPTEARLAVATHPDTVEVWTFDDSALGAPRVPQSPLAGAATLANTHRHENRPMPAVEVFYSYSHRDETLRDELEKHLALLKRQGVISGWHDRRIVPGTKWAGEIDKHLESARIILLLVSSDFLASDYCYEIEMKRAMARHDAGEAVVVPIILRPCDWQSAPFGRVQGLPKDAKPVTTWTNQDEAFLDIARNIRAVIQS